MNDYSKMWGEYCIYAFQRETNFSENIILSIILERFEVKNMVDFGCAIGRWCKEAKNLGVKEVLGIDGEYVNQESLVIDKEEFIGTDLEKPIFLPKRYDLAISLEVAEHLPEEKSDIFVENLVRSSDLILFSAAIPGQGGDFHVNEQLISYWQKKFEKHGYFLHDFLRPIIWKNDKVLPMYKQNCVIFMKQNNNYAQSNYIVDMVHPEIFISMAKRGIMLFPFHEIKKDSRVVLYGAGTVGNQYYRQLQATNYCKELIWIDRSRKLACVDCCAVDIQSTDVIKTIKADYYVVAVEDEKIASEIITELNVYDISKNKIIYHPIRITRY